MNGWCGEYAIKFGLLIMLSDENPHKILGDFHFRLSDLKSRHRLHCSSQKAEVSRLLFPDLAYRLGNMLASPY